MNEPKLTRSLYQQLEAIIKSTEPGGRLPAEPQLARQLKVSRSTLREAMRIFDTRGMLRHRQGVGTFVVRPTIIESGLEILESIETQAARIGLSVSMGQLNVEACPDGDKAVEQLSLNAGDTVICVSRIILTGGRPVAYLVDKLPEKFLSAAEVNGGFTGSVLDLLLRRGNPLLGSSRCEIKALAADAVIARALDIQRGDAVQCFESLLPVSCFVFGIRPPDVDKVRKVFN